MDCHEFFSEMYREAEFDTGDHIGLFTLPDAKSTQATSVDEAVGLVSKMDAGLDVYFCVQPLAKVEAGRGKLPHIKRVVAMIADVDYGEGTSKKRFTTQDAAYSFLMEKTGLKPSVVVCSGGGLHGYWLLDKAIRADDVATRTVARQFAIDWGDALLHRARLAGAELDNVSDLPRILRVPGTHNHKQEEPRAVYVLSDWEPIRYTKEQLAKQFLPKSQRRQAGTSGAVAGGAAWNKDAELGPLLLTTLCNTDPKFDATWGKRRDDFDDQSFSTYDMSLANYGVDNGWPDDTIKDAIVHFRRLHGGDMAKATRADYLNRTVDKAKRDNAAAVALRDATKHVASVAVPGSPVPPTPVPEVVPTVAEEKARVLKTIGTLLDIPIERFVKHGQEEPRYYLVLADGTDLQLGGVREVMSQASFLRAMFVGCNRVVTQMTRNTWQQFLTLLMQIQEFEENVTDGRVNMFSSWVADYMDGKVARGHDEAAEAIAAEDPFMYKMREWNAAKLHIPSTQFWTHVGTLHPDKVSNADRAALLRAAGARVERRQAMSKDGRNVSRTCVVIDDWGRVPKKQEKTNG